MWRKDVDMLMSPITIGIALLACALLVAVTYLLVDERA
jgi:hypothetical protein